MRPWNRIAPLASSMMANQNGWSTWNTCFSSGGRCAAAASRKKDDAHPRDRRLRIGVDDAAGNHCSAGWSLGAVSGKKGR